MPLLKRSSAALLLLAIILAANIGVAQNPNTTAQAYQQALIDTQTAENTMLLYLRMAGLLWIVLEWIAAILLWRGYNHLKRYIDEKGLSHD